MGKGIVYALYGAGNLQCGEIYPYQLLRAIRPSTDYLYHLAL